MQTPYELLGREQGLRRLCEAFYRIMDESPEAAGIRAMHGESLVPITEKLFEYLSGWMGGPMLYYQRKKTVCLTEPHAPYAIGPVERDQWLLCMERALEAVDAPPEAREMLRKPLFQVADMIVNRRDARPPAPQTIPLRELRT